MTPKLPGYFSFSVHSKRLIFHLPYLLDTPSMVTPGDLLAAHSALESTSKYYRANRPTYTLPVTSDNPYVPEDRNLYNQPSRDRTEILWSWNQKEYFSFPLFTAMTPYPIPERFFVKLAQ